MPSRCRKLSASIAVLALVVPMLVYAQGAPPFGQSPPAPQTPRTGKESAPVDLTGYWVSVVTEDWRWRMVTPIKGDFSGIPINREAQRIGLEWDPVKDEAAGRLCLAYGAPAIMRLPGRVHITWQDDNTLRIETDAGTQTRLFHFGAPPAADVPPSAQGHSVANWEQPARGVEPTEMFSVFTRRTAMQGRALEVTTTHLTPGYYRKNGPPYSGEAMVQEFYDHHVHPNGDVWFTVTTIVNDPLYLRGPYVTSTDFRQEPDGRRWNPTPCSVK